MNRLIGSSVSKAVFDDNLEALRRLLDVGNRTDVQDNLGWTPLHAAVSKHRLDMIELLATQEDAPINTRCYEGQTPLLLACMERCCTQIISALLISGADPCIPNNEDMTPLHLTQDPHTAELLLTFGANVNAQDFNKYTPLHCAVEHDNPELLEVLLTAGADTSLRELNGLNPYMLTFQEHFNCMDRLLEVTENINAVADDSWSCLMLAINAGKIDNAFRLINRGADVNIIVQNLSPLHLAVMRQEVELFNCLWDKINFNIIKKAYSLPHLMLIHRWYVPGRVECFFKVLENPDSYNTMDNSQNFLGFLFGFEMDNKLEVVICDIVSRILNCIVSVDSVELISFIQNYFNRKYKFELLELLKTKCDLDQPKILHVATEYDPEMVPRILTQSLSTNPRDIFKFLTNISRMDLQVLKLMLYVLNFFTPVNLFRTRYCTKLKDSDIYNQDNVHYVLERSMAGGRIFRIIEYPLEQDRKQLMCGLHDKILDIVSVNRAPSLQELSRDAIRLCFKRNFGKWSNCDNALYRLGLPNDIIDIIKLKKPVNSFM